MVQRSTHCVCGVVSHKEKGGTTESIITTVRKMNRHLILESHVKTIVKLLIENMVDSYYFYKLKSK